MDDRTKKRISIVFVSVVMVAIFVAQYRASKSISAVDLPVHRSREIANEYTKLQEENERNIKEIESLRQKISIYESDKANEDEFLENLYDEIDRYKSLSGYKELQGQGIRINIRDPLDYSDSSDRILHHHENIIEIINVLNAVEAEAISVNGQRYTSFTEIVPAGNHIEINGVSQGAPFEIVAIGNSSDLENALRLKGGIVWLMENQYGIQVDIFQEDSLDVPEYTRVMEYRYAQPVE